MSKTNFLTTLEVLPHHKSREGDKPNKGNGIQCHECEGFRHILEKCTNFLRNQKKGYPNAYSDEESEDESDGEKSNSVVAFTTCVISKPNDQNDGESSDEDLLDEDVVKAYRQQYLKWKEECMSG